MTSTNTRARGQRAPIGAAHARAHDLPPKWDGARVTWSAWEPEQATTFRFHVDANELACTACGLIELRDVATGRVHPPDGVTELYPFHARLRVERCRGCAHDTVHDLDDDEHWDLEPEDYTDAGSEPPSNGMLW